MLPILRLIYFNSLIDTTFLSVYRYDQSFLFKPMLRSVFSTWTDVTIGVLDLCTCYRRYDWYYQFVAPFYLLMLMVRSNSRMLVVFIHKTVFL